MKNAVFLGLIAFCFSTHPLEYNQIVNAIIESDYNYLVNNQKEVIITHQQKQQLLKINDDVLTLRQEWMVKHAGEPHMGTDLFLSGLAAVVSITSLIAWAGYSSAHTSGVYDTAISQCVAGSIGIAGLVYTVKKYIDAYLKPKRLLQNALLIKALLYSL